MNVREKVEAVLIELGMFKQQAEKVMDIVIPKIDAISDDYKIEWNKWFDFYGDDMYEFIFSIVKPETLVWIDEHVPNAWFKENFVD